MLVLFLLELLLLFLLFDEYIKNNLRKILVSYDPDSYLIRSFVSYLFDDFWFFCWLYFLITDLLFPIDPSLLSLSFLLVFPTVFYLINPKTLLIRQLFLKFFFSTISSFTLFICLKYSSLFNPTINFDL